MQNKTTMKEENKVIYDWVSIRSNIHSVNNFIEDLGLDKPSIEWQELYGFYGYKHRLYFEGISIHYDGHSDNMGILLEMSGQGCRAFETYGNGNYDSLFTILSDEPQDVKLTRLDVAYDDFSGLLDLDKIQNALWVGDYTCRSTKFNCQRGSDGQSVEIGSKKSDLFIRIYDKAQERGRADEIKHWVRFELQMRDNHAYNFVSGNGDIGYKFYAVINNYIRFLEHNYDDDNKSRWDSAVWWIEFLDHTRKMSLFDKPGTEYNLSKLMDYVVSQAGNSIHTYIECLGLDQFLYDIQHRPSTLKAHQQALINKFKYNDDTTSN